MAASGIPSSRVAAAIVAIRITMSNNRIMMSNSLVIVEIGITMHRFEYAIKFNTNRIDLEPTDQASEAVATAEDGGTC